MRVRGCYLDSENCSMSMHQNERLCLSCNKILKGRADKKYCDDYCRNAFNNQLKLKSSHYNYVRNVNNTLIKNRRILENLITQRGETAKEKKEKLLRQGFDFRYLTHTYTNKLGKTYYYCYDHGYLPLENEWYLIVRQKR